MSSGRVRNGRARGDQCIRYRLRGRGESGNGAIQVAAGRLCEGERPSAGPVPDLTAFCGDGRVYPRAGLLDQAQFVSQLGDKAGVVQHQDQRLRCRGEQVTEPRQGRMQRHDRHAVFMLVEDGHQQPALRPR